MQRRLRKTLATADLGDDPADDVKDLSGILVESVTYDSRSLFHVQLEPAFFRASGRFALECPRNIAAVVKRG
jgi:hypothetical protein